MKNIVIFTMGTRGDVQPYIFLAQALIKKGHRVTQGDSKPVRQFG